MIKWSGEEKINFTKIKRINPRTRQLRNTPLMKFHSKISSSAGRSFCRVWWQLSQRIRKHNKARAPKIKVYIGNKRERDKPLVIWKCVQNMYFFFSRRQAGALRGQNVHLSGCVRVPQLQWPPPKVVQQRKRDKEEKKITHSSDVCRRL